MVLEGQKVVKDKPSASRWFNEMNAISRGVETRLDSLIGFSGMVTLETITIAQQLRIPERQIKRWAASRFKVECSTRGQISPTQPRSKRGG
jgi:hypothetical protein